MHGVSLENPISNQDTTANCIIERCEGVILLGD